MAKQTQPEEKSGTTKRWNFSTENEKKAKKVAKQQKESSGGGGNSIGKDDRMKLKSRRNRIFILQPWDQKGELTKRVMVHQVWKNKMPVASAACPRITEGEDCEVCKYAWEIKDKYQESTNQRKQNLWRLFKATTDNYVNAIDLDADSKKARVLKLPHLAYEALMEELSDDAVGLKEVCHLDEGRAMVIKGNGKEGNARKYEVCKFENKPANLASNGDVDEEEILNGIHNLDKLQPKPNEKKLEEVFAKLKKQALLGDDEEDTEEDEEETDDEETEDEVDGDDDDDSDDDKPAKKKAAKKSKPADDDEDEEESEDEEDSDDEDEEDKKPVKKKPAKKSKPADDEDDDEEDDDEEESDDDEDEESDDEDEESDDDSDDDDDDDDFEDDEEEKPAPKKKSSLPLKKKKH